MSQPGRTKHPLDVLQSMINAILIETGKALRSSNKEGGKTLANAKTRLSSTIPSTIENFHLALDEMECDILRAKSVLLRDLEGLRAKRLALENPVPIVEEVEPISELELDLNGEATTTDAGERSTIKKEATQSESPEKQTSDETGFPSSTQDPAKEDIFKIAEDSKDQQALTPPPLNDNTSQPIGLGINTEGVANSPGPGTAEPQDSIDLLFDIPDNENTGDSELNFEPMDYSLPDSNQDPSQTQAHAFELSTFGTASQDFSMNTMQTDSNTANNTNSSNKEGEALFGMGNGGDNMDLDMENMGFGTAGGEDSLFDEIFVDDGVFGDSGEMEHSDFDNAFFGLDN